MILYALLGLLALAVLWTHSGLIAAVAWRRASWWGRHRKPRPLKPGHPLPTGYAYTRVQVAEDQPALARHRLHQRGRQLDAKVPTIGWHDQGSESHVDGGRVRWGDREVTVSAGPEGRMWPAPSLAERAGEVDDFEATLALARRARGFERVLETDAKPGDHVYLAGYWRSHEDGLQVVAGEEPVVVSQMDPRAWCQRIQWELRSFSIAVLLSAAAITWLATRPPLFGAVSTIGGALGLLFFLLVQPWGTAMRDRALEPDRRPVLARSLGPSGRDPETATPTADELR